jgi:hypothetical protein
MLGNIYLITNTITDKVYVGSTFLTLTERFDLHKGQHFFGKSRVYQQMRILGFRNFRIELIKNYEGNRDGLRREESKELLKFERTLWLNQRMPHIAYSDYKGSRTFCQVCQCSVLSNKFARHRRALKHTNNMCPPCIL